MIIHPTRYIGECHSTKIDISDKIAAIITKLKLSQIVSVEEKLIDRKLSLEFSAERIKLVMNNNSISINAQDEYYILTRILSRKDEIAYKIRTLRYEVEKSSYNSEEKRKASSLLKRMEYILTPIADSGANSRVGKFKSWIIHNKSLFTVKSPFIMEIIELIEYMIKYSQ
ncbi:MAG: hypothetical protein ACJ718_01385 [Nitrososphaeraceae archaeon]